MLLLMVVCGMVLDIGNAYRVKTGLQASADAAAAAGADQLPNTGNAASAVQQYGSNPAGKNPVRGRVTSPSRASPTASPRRSSAIRPTRCRSRRAPPCRRHFCGDRDRHHPHHRALPGMLTVRREAARHHGRARPHRIDARQQARDAKDGIKAFLSTMDTGLDNVGLAVLPPATNSRTACAAPRTLELRQRQRRLRAGAAVEHLRHHDQRQHHAQSRTRRCCRRSTVSRPTARPHMQPRLTLPRPRSTRTAEPESRR